MQNTEEKILSRLSAIMTSATSARLTFSLDAVLFQRLNCAWCWSNAFWLSRMLFSFRLINGPSAFECVLKRENSVPFSGFFFSGRGLLHYFSFCWTNCCWLSVCLPLCREINLRFNKKTSRIKQNNRKHYTSLSIIKRHFFVFSTAITKMMMKKIENPTQ